jgi:murein DD-endopeptidase MepM/ murein hydrolase activator NlpD
MGTGVLAKADRLPRLSERVGTRQVLNLSTLTRIGDRDLVRVRPFVRVSAPLTMRKADVSAEIPPFNPLKVFADSDMLSGRASSAKNPSFYDADVEGEITLRTRDLPSDTTTFDPDVVMMATEVERIVADQARFLSDGSIQTAALPVSGSMAGFGEFTAPAGLTSALAMRIVPENVSFFPKSDSDNAGPQTGNGLDEKTVTVDRNDTLKTLVLQAGGDDRTATDIAKALAKSFDIRGLEPGQKVRIGTAKIDASEQLKPVRVSIYGRDSAHLGTVALDDYGAFVGAEDPGTGGDIAADDEDETVAEASGVPSLYYSLYQTALDNQVSRALIKQLVDIYSYDVDFNQRVKHGDQFEVLYASDDESNPKSTQEVLYAAITINGQPKKYYRYRSPDDGSVDYYDESGKSAKKFLMRKPMDGGVFRSGFGGRRHPVLGYYRMHTGVDWAAPTGTPIYASGNGTITELGWKGGYGRYVRIKHNNGYETGYGHMSGFGRGLDKGSRVRQGQIIGYVGSTGVSTGPHCHYEVLINSAFVDPMRVKLPRGKELGGPVLAEFQRERERIDALMAKSPAMNKLASSLN